MGQGQSHNFSQSHINIWNKYLFLYYNQNLQHYELISFDFIENKIIKEPQLKIKKIIHRLVIFEN
jgi:hypothetical protein